MEPPSLSRSISPPPRRRIQSTGTTTDTPKAQSDDIKRSRSRNDISPSLAAIEAGQAQILNHLDYFTQHFRSFRRESRHPILSIEDFRALYLRNQHHHGRHFVVHQHDHPVSGVHYDLRLQFSESSTLSFAIPYGLPGNPNSVRPNRMAVETRVHTLWIQNNLIEAASHATGSLLIWDTGEYEILPWKDAQRRSTDDEDSIDDKTPIQRNGQSQSEQLSASFRRRRMRIRLHGSKLPENYTISMWLTSSNNRERQPKRPQRKRRRVDPSQVAKNKQAVTDDENSEEETETIDVSTESHDEETAAALASDNEEDDVIHTNNAYMGASNTIGSVHQRNWFMTLDRKNSGFRRTRSGAEEGQWVGGFEPLFVLGRDFETSIVTGRNADEVMEDEGVAKFVGRKMWIPITS